MAGVLPQFETQKRISNTSNFITAKTWKCVIEISGQSSASIIVGMTRIEATAPSIHILSIGTYSTGQNPKVIAKKLIGDSTTSFCYTNISGMIRVYAYIDVDYNVYSSQLLLSFGSTIRMPDERLYSKPSGAVDITLS